MAASYVSDTTGPSTSGTPEHCEKDNAFARMCLPSPLIGTLLCQVRTARSAQQEPAPRMRRQPAASAINVTCCRYAAVIVKSPSGHLHVLRTTRLYAIHLVDNTVVCGYVLGSRISGSYCRGPLYHDITDPPGDDSHCLRALLSMEDGQHMRHLPRPDQPSPLTARHLAHTSPQVTHTGTVYPKK